MVKSLKELRKERDELLRKANAKKSLDSLAMSRNIEGRKLEAEIKALKNPRSIQAVKTFKRLGKSFGRSILRGAANVSANIEESRKAEQRREAMKRSKPKRIVVKKGIRKGPTKRRKRR